MLLNDLLLSVRSVAGLVMQASGNLVEVDIYSGTVKVSMSWCWHTSVGLVLMMVKEIDLKLTLQYWERWLRGEKLSLYLMRNHRVGVSCPNLVRPEVTRPGTRLTCTPLQVSLGLWAYSQAMGHGGWWRISPGLEGWETGIPQREPRPNPTAVSLPESALGSPC